MFVMQGVRCCRGPVQQPQPQHVIIGYMLVTPQDSCSCDLRLEGWLVRRVLWALHVARQRAAMLHLSLLTPASSPCRTLLTVESAQDPCTARIASY